MQGGLEIPYGDVDQDGLITISDIVTMLDLLNDVNYSEIADITGDGIVNVVDLVSLVPLILEL